MLAACRLAGLSALEAIYGRSRRRAIRIGEERHFALLGPQVSLAPSPGRPVSGWGVLQERLATACFSQRGVNAQ
jgi:hypothetical protein